MAFGHLTCRRSRRCPVKLHVRESSGANCKCEMRANKVSDKRSRRFEMKETSKQTGTTLILLFVLGIFTNAVFAQSNTGSISGIVQDQGGAIIRGATITVTNVGTNETRTAQSNDEGYYEVPSLATGVYKVVGTASGFQETTVSDARLAVGEKHRVVLKMPVGGVTASVTVADQTTT